MTEISGDYLRSQRERPVVLKSELARIRSSSRCALVFILEGADDLVVYDVWIRRINSALAWEPLVANGKKNALALREMLRRDRTGLSVCTYFIIDHDYDGLRGQSEGKDVFVLPAYSVENYLAGPEVLEAILRTDLQVLGEPLVRERVVQAYTAALDTYAGLLVEPCSRLGGAKGCDVGNVVIDENGLRPFTISLTVTNVQDSMRLKNMVRTERPVPPEALASASAFFAHADLRMWIRGKFLCLFLKRWVDLLLTDRRSAVPSMFSVSLPSLTFQPASVDFRSLSSRCRLPDGFAHFISDATRECAEIC